MRRELAEWQRFLRGVAHLIAGRPDLLFQDAANQPSSTCPARAADALAARRRRPWLRWVNKPERPSPCLLTLPAAELAESCDFSVDGRLIACACGTGDVMVWNTDTGERRDTIPGMGTRFFCFAPTGSRMLALGNRLWIWDASGSLLDLALPDSEVLACGFSHDGSWVLAGDRSGAVHVWDAHSGQKLMELRRGEAPALALLMDPGRRLIWATADGRILKAELPSGALLGECEIADRPVTHWALSPDGTRAVASGGTPERMALWDTASGQELAPLPDRSRPRSCEFSPDGRWLAARFAPEGALILWDGHTGRQHCEIRGMVARWRFAPDAIHAAVALYGGEVRLVEIESLQKVVTYQTSGGGALVDCRASPDTASFASVNEGGLVQLWSAERGEHQPEPALGRIWTLTLAGDRFACGLESGHVVLGDFETGALQDPLPHGLVLRNRGTPSYEEDPCVTACAISADGSRLLSGAYDGTLTLWDLANRQQIAAWQGHGGMVTACSLTADGGLCASGGDDRLWRTWLPSGEEIANVRLPGGITTSWFSPDGTRLLATGKDDFLHLWLEPWTGEVFSARVSGERFALSPDRAQLLATHPTGAMYLWNLLDFWDGMIPDQICSFRPGGGELVGCGFRSPHEPVSISMDGWVEVWDAETGERVADLRTGRRCLGAVVRGDHLAVVTGPRPLHLGRMGEDWFGPGFPSDQMHVFQLVQ